jgi:pimeloyl-ACP methyl ester carboxylesterase
MRWKLLSLSLLAAMVLSAAASAGPLSAPNQTFVQAPGPLGPLKGTMLAPADGHTPVMLIIPGSGPTDRDGNNPLGVKASSYKLLAEGLAAHDIGTVRIDKRGAFGSIAAVADGNAVTIDDYVADVGAWIEVIRKETGVSCVWLLGHSEGGLVALAAAQKLPDVCGLVLVSAAGRPLGEVLRTQLRANAANAPVLPQALAAIDALEAGKRFDVAGMHPALMPLFGPKVQGFLINAFSYDPAKLIAAVSKPVLILQGRRDIQIGVGDAERLKEAAPKAELVLLPDTNHVLKVVTSDDMQANVATYMDPALPLAPGVVEAIAKFVAASKEIK